MTEEKNAALGEAAQETYKNYYTGAETDEQTKVKKLINARIEKVIKEKDPANAAKALLDKTSGRLEEHNPLLKPLDDWNQPAPLSIGPPQLDYPLNILPSIIRDAVIEVQEVTQAPLAIVASSAICAISTGTQGLLDVSRDHHLSGPTSLFFLTLGDSGERKSTVDGLFGKSLKEFQAAATEKSAPELTTYTASLEGWQASCDGIKNQIRQSKGKQKSGKSEDVSQLQLSLNHLHKNKPQRPLIPNILIQDITTEKLVHQLANEWPSCLITSAEGGLVLGGRSLSRENQLATLAALNALWSDESIRISRKTTDSFEIQRARLSLSLSVQSEVFKKFTEDNEVARSIGFLARCLFSFPESTQGRRPFKTQPKILPALENFNQHVKKLLEISPQFQNRKLKTTLIPFNNAAKKKWICFHDEVEIRLAKGNDLASLRDFGSKAAENAARLACVFEATKPFPILEIDEESIIAGIAIADWHLNEAFRFFGQQTPEKTRISKIAIKLEAWLVNQCRNAATTFIDKNHVMQYGPNPTRSKESLLEAVGYLKTRERARFSSDGRSIELNPMLIEEDQQWRGQY